MTEPLPTHRCSGIRWIATLAMATLLHSTLANAESLEPATEQAIEALRLALDEDDLAAFGRVLDNGVLDASIFARSQAAYDILCDATYEERERFLGPLLDIGVDASTLSPSGVLFDFNPLSCASSLGNARTFQQLLDAGADSAVSLCPDCQGPERHTVVTYITRYPELLDMVIDKRKLTTPELDGLASYASKVPIRGTHKNLPVNVYYANLLREHGYDIVPALREDPEPCMPCDDGSGGRDATGER